MSILFLREREERDKYESLFKNSFKVNFIPVLSISLRKLPFEGCIGCAISKKYSGIIVTSAKAFRALDTQTVHRPCTQHNQTVNVYAVGDKTGVKASRVLGKYFEVVNVLGTESGYGTTLGNFVVNNHSLGNSSLPLLFLCGKEKRPELPRILKAANIPFEELITYETCTRPDVDKEVAANLNDARGIKGPKWIVFFSPSGVNALSEVLRSYLDDCPGDFKIAAIGSTTAAELRRIFSDIEVTVPKNPSSESLLAEILASS
jgi:uroporphyrinogen-III synthase